LSVVGLADYYGTFASFYITNASVPQTVVTTWWEHIVVPWVGRVRYFGLAACAVGAALVGPPAGAPPESGVSSVAGPPDADGLLPIAARPVD
jgi:hypothetical protein